MEFLLLSGIQQHTTLTKEKQEMEGGKGGKKGKENRAKEPILLRHLILEALGRLTQVGLGLLEILSREKYGVLGRVGVGPGAPGTHLRPSSRTGQTG